MAIEQEKQPNPYVLTREQRIVPRDTKKAQKEWLKEVIAIQQEGIAHGVKPQLLKLTEEQEITWRRQVWTPYLKAQGNKHRWAAMNYSQGRSFHSHPQTGGPAPTPLKYRYGGRSSA